jgi:diguanylate cyclase (GGDEF)-like protein
LTDSQNHAGGKILLLADGEIGQDLAARFESDRVLCAADPYDALKELAGRDCSTVILPAPRPEIKGLAKAIRRLNGKAKLMAFCRTDDLDAVAAETEGLIDECCLFPPTRGELNALLRGLEAGAPVERLPTAISTETLTRLIAATKTFKNLEAEIAGVVSRVLDAPVKWIDLSQNPAGAELLLILQGEPARALIPEHPVRFNEEFDALIGDLQQTLPSLVGISRRTETLRRLAVTDHLTGAYNRRYFYHLTDQVLCRAEEKQFRATLLLYDIDDFKRYNDRYGHAVGDEILRDTARMIKRISRDHDIVARIGGDEFAVLFWDRAPRSPDSEPLKNAWALADRFRRAVENHQLASLGPAASGTLTISGGLASFPENGRNCLDLLRSADRALRKAKESGKNSIHLVGQDAPPE